MLFRFWPCLVRCTSKITRKTASFTNTCSFRAMNDLNQGTDEDEDPRLNNHYGNINENYQSEAWEKNNTDTLESFSVPHPHQSQTQLQTQDYQQTQAQKQQLNNPSLALFR